jgi:hypothetical protein
MNNEFIPYEQALALKELGFNEECLAGYIRFRGSETFELAFYKYRNVDFNTTSNIYVSAPLCQQVFRWFREKYNLNSYISFETIDDSETAYVWNIIKYLPEGKGRKKDTWDFYERIDSFSKMLWYNTYEEAELECIKKLIERVKNIL